MFTDRYTVIKGYYRIEHSLFRSKYKLCYYIANSTKFFRLAEEYSSKSKDSFMHLFHLCLEIIAKQENYPIGLKPPYFYKVILKNVYVYF